MRPKTVIRSLLFLVPLAAAFAAAPDPETLYAERCAACHDRSAETRAPQREALARLSAEAVLAALETGSMQEAAAELATADRRALASHLSGKAFNQAGDAPSPGLCDAEPAEIPWPLQGPRWNGWGGALDNGRFQDDPGIKPADLDRLEVAWTFGFPDVANAYAQPSLAAGRVFVGSADRHIYSLDAASGCIYWQFPADAAIRSGVVLGPAGDRTAAFFGDLQANLYALDARTGALIWKLKADPHPYARFTGSPAYHDGRVYAPVSSVEEGPAGRPDYACCTFRGSVIAVEAATGRLRWQSYTIEDAPRPIGKKINGSDLLGPSGAAVWSPPTIDAVNNSLIIASGNHYTDRGPDGDPVSDSDAVIAFDLHSGARKWSRQFTPRDRWNFSCSSRRDPANCPADSGPDFDFGAPPILRILSNGRPVLLAGQKSGMLHALDAADGELLWESLGAPGGMLGGIEWGMAADRTLVYTPKSAPQLRDAAGGIAAFQIATGEKIWDTLAPEPQCEGCGRAQMAAASVIPGLVFSGSMDGRLRAYAAADGKILWEFNTARKWTTVNGVEANGGSLNGPGPAVAGGMIFVNSGYGQWGGMPGNVLIALRLAPR